MDQTELQTVPGLDADGQPLEVQVTAVGRELARTIGSVLESVPGGPHRATELSRLLGVNKDVSSRVLRATRLTDPMAVAQAIPGPAPLRKILRAARRHNAPPERVSAAEAAVRKFDELIREEAGDRGVFDAMISAWIPESREKHELLAKQMAFKGTALLKGVAAEVNLGTALVHPSESGKEGDLDLVLVMGLIGLHRYHPSANVRLASYQVNPSRPAQRQTLDGDPVESIDGLRLDEFCAGPPLSLRAKPTEGAMHYTLAEGRIGLNASADVILAELQRAGMSRYRPENPVGRGDGFISADVTIPVKQLILDVLVADGAFDGVNARPRIYDMIPEGIADVNDASRDIDQLNLAENIQDCGRGTERLRTPEVPRYTDMLGHVCARMGWNPARFRAYRCRVAFPVYGSQVCMIFPREPAPGA